MEKMMKITVRSDSGLALLFFVDVYSQHKRG
jgi:hypothetical protein